ncbi:MAG: thiamine diphosphokinase [Acidimicrobiales bacterium mtb01]|nr:thiamine diphosphokinase [Actinomycetota bacterium]TEX47871.1 MAG: thiamine diphosphokinase [Acidimicrobiales bacterium mtb01]
MDQRHALLVIGGDAPRRHALDGIEPVDVIICADSGFDHALGLDLVPHVVIGDMDSIADVDRARAHGSRIVEAHPDKDFTDTELALAHALADGATSLTVLWGGGDRFDHVLGVLAALAAPDLGRLERLTAWVGDDRMHIVHGGRQVRFTTEVGRTVSLVPLAGSAHGVTTTGLRWTLENASLEGSRARGVSNVAVAETVNVSVASGCVGVVLPKGTA